MHNHYVTHIELGDVVGEVDGVVVDIRGLTEIKCTTANDSPI